MDVIDPGNLLRDSWIIIGACTWFACSAVLPLDLAGACRELVAGIETCHRKFLPGYAEGVLDGGDPFGVLAGFEVCLRKAREIQKVLERASVAIDGLDSDAPRDVLDAINSWLMPVERPLVRLNYVEAPEYLQDPALPMPPVPVLSAVDAFLKTPQETGKCAALVELRRGLNLS